MNVSSYRSLCIEIYKTLNHNNPSFIKDIFKLRMTNRPTQEKYKLNLEIPKIWNEKFEIPWSEGLEKLKLFTIPYKIFRKPNHF